MLTQLELCRKNKADHCMKPTKIATFLEEFPWIKKNLGDCLIRQVYVSRVETEFLYYSPLVNNQQMFFTFWEKLTYERIFLLSEKGEVLNVSQKSTIKFFNKNDIETVTIHGVVFSRLSVINLIETMNFHRRDDIRYFMSYCELTGAVIVCKLLKNISLLEMINEELTSEKSKIQKEITTIG